MRSLFVLIACLLVLSSVHGAVDYTWYNLQIDGDLYWSGTNVVFMIADDTLYRSIDEGKTWVSQSQYLPVSGTTTGVVRIHKDPVDDSEQKFVFVASDNRLGWVTWNAGANYTQITFPGSISRGNLEFNTKISGWFLVSTGTNCNNVYSCEYFVSRDFGTSFHSIGKGLYTVHWDGFPKGASETILAIDPSRNYIYTNDFGASSTVIFKQAIDFLFTQHHLYIVVRDLNTDEGILYASNDNSVSSSSYHEARFPFGDELPQYQYRFLDDETPAEWMGVLNDDYWGTIYSSDAAGVQFATTLQHAHYGRGYFDFDRVHGLEGIYIANNVTNFESNDESALKLTTLITFDNGGEWKYLAPPKVDSKGSPIMCTGDCSLHLHGFTSWQKAPGQEFGYFYSSGNAIGLILATGNIGEYLDLSGTVVNTYFSRDAGLTWTELMQGSHIYEIGDHGGIIVLADNKNPSNIIWYSLDEGQSWNQEQFTQTVVTSNIRIEPSGTARKFILQGTQNTGGNSVGVTIGLDFTSVQPRMCVDSDYETWNPTDGRANGQTCQLGRNVTYIRRKQSANCFNNRTTEHILSTVNCVCAMEDYECDFGYEETIVDGKFTCVLKMTPPADPPKDCAPGAQYAKSKGYRRVAGDTCFNDIPNILPDMKVCPLIPGGSESKNTALIAVVVIFVVLAVLGIVGFFVYRNEEWREKVLDVVGKVIPINRGPAYSRVGRHGILSGDEEFGIGGDHDIDDDVEEDAPVLHDADIQKATSSEKRDDFDPRS